MLVVGRLCVKTAGRDACEYCVVVEEIDSNFVLVDGNTRRKKVNKRHLEPLGKVLKVKKGASTKEVTELLEKEGIKLKKKGESRKPKEQVKKIREKAKTDKDKKKEKKKK